MSGRSGGAVKRRARSNGRPVDVVSGPAAANEGSVGGAERSGERAGRPVTRAERSAERAGRSVGRAGPSARRSRRSLASSGRFTAFAERPLAWTARFTAFPGRSLASTGRFMAFAGRSLASSGRFMAFAGRSLASTERFMAFAGRSLASTARFTTSAEGSLASRGRAAHAPMNLACEVWVGELLDNGLQIFTQSGQLVASALDEHGASFSQVGPSVFIGDQLVIASDIGITFYDVTAKP